MSDYLAGSKRPDNVVSHGERTRQALDEGSNFWISSSQTNNPHLGALGEYESTVPVPGFTEIAWDWQADEILLDSNSMFDENNPEYFTFRQTGVYNYSLFFLIDAAVSHPSRTIDWTLRIYIDGSLARQAEFTLSADIPTGSLTLGGISGFNNGQEISFTIEHDDGSSISFLGIELSFSVFRLIT